MQEKYFKKQKESKIANLRINNKKIKQDCHILSQTKQKKGKA